MLSKTLENDAKVLGMFFFILGIYKNVVNENHDKLVQFRHKHRVHKIHEMRWGIGQLKRHDQILIESIFGREGRLGDILSSDLDLGRPSEDQFLRIP